MWCGHSRTMQRGTRKALSEKARANEWDETIARAGTFSERQTPRQT
jgi:hypothetical protein